MKPDTLAVRTHASASRRRVVGSVVAFAMAGLGSIAQQTPTPAPSTPETADDEVVVLSPFEVTAEETEGYGATETLAGTRLRTDLRDIASPIQVITAEFLKDTGSKRTEDLLVYTTNTEVGGQYGNFAGVGNTQGANEGRNLTQPHTNTRVRGLDAADNTRNYFLTDLPWDAYNVDRVDIQRGPNSILYGVASPAGIVNTSTLPASFANSGNIENVLGEYGSVRYSTNFNRVLVKDLLAVRLAAVSDKRGYEQKPAYEKDKRVYGAVAFQPRLFGEQHSALSIKASIEDGKIDANRPRMLPPNDQITPWWTGMNQQVYDPAWAWSSGALLDRGTKPANYGAIVQPWLGNEQDGITGGATGFFYNNGESQPFLIQSTGANDEWSIGSNGQVDRSISGYVFGRRVDIAGFNEFSLNANRANPNFLPAANKNFYKDKSLVDTSVFDFYGNLIDGPNKYEWSDWTAYNVAVAQTFFNNRFGVELVYDFQELDRGREGLFGGSTFLSVDINTHTNNIPTEYPARAQWTNMWPEPNSVTGGELNPGVGRAYVSGSGGSGDWQSVTRKNMRGTAFVQVHGSDFFEDDSLLARIIGRNTFTGLVSREDRAFFGADWNLFATEVDYARSQNVPIGITEYPRRVPVAIYLTDDLRSVDDYRGLDIDRVKTFVNPNGEYMVRYFDSHWRYPLDPNAAGYVDPAAPYAEPWDGDPSTQSENWRNYVGWTQMPVEIYNAREGDIENLYRNASRRNEILDSVGLTYQGFLLDGIVVPTVGWRRDKIETWGAQGTRAPDTNVASIKFDNPKSGAEVVTSEGDTVSWGVVLHSPKWLDEKMPGGVRVSAFYNSSENFRAENRIGFDTMPLPNPTGDSTDYGIILSTPDSKYAFKLTYFETKVKDASIPGGNPLGSNSWFLQNVEAWGTASALTHEMYWNNELPGMNWFSNYGLVDNNMWGDPVWEDVTNAVPRNDPANQALFAAVQDWYATMPDQFFFDGYGLPINREAAQGSYQDRKARLVMNGTWNPYNGIGSIQGSGTRGGLSPTGTFDQQSEGWEFELTARPIPSLNLMFNAAKTEAQRTALGSAFMEWIETQKARFDGPAGDIRMWWGGDQTIRKYYQDFIYQPYLFQLDANGQDAAEIRPWRFNMVANYSFSTSWLKGVNVGLGYRWQDEVILGYQLDDTLSKLDVTRPITGGAEDSIDFWAGYSFKVSDKVNWRIQVNVRNLFDGPHLIPVSVNPDGAVATWRIAEGQRLSLTNTITF